MIRFLVAVRAALEGVVYGLKTQRHLRFHLLAAVLAVTAGIWRALTPGGWGLLILLIAAVIAAELLNTAIEAVVDLVSPDYHPLAKAAKDTAAGAVLILAIAALLVAVVLFIV